MELFPHVHVSPFADVWLQWSTHYSVYFIPFCMDVWIPEDIYLTCLVTKAIRYDNELRGIIK